MEIKCEGSAAEIYGKVKRKLTEIRDQGKLAQLKSIDFEDPACQAVATGTGFKSVIQCEDGRVVVDLDLNFLLKPMRGQIEETIRRSLSKALGVL